MCFSMTQIISNLISYHNLFGKSDLLSYNRNLATSFSQQITFPEITTVKTFLSFQTGDMVLKSNLTWPLKIYRNPKDWSSNSIVMSKASFELVIPPPPFLWLWAAFYCPGAEQSV